VLHRLEQRVVCTAAELEQRQRRYDEVTATLDALRTEVEQESLQCDADLELLDEADQRGAESPVHSSEPQKTAPV
jgi:ABC-type phosphate transport system auxiliary subunit